MAPRIALALILGLAVPAAATESDFGNLQPFQEQIQLAQNVNTRPLQPSPSPMSRAQAEASGGPAIFCSIPLRERRTRPVMDRRWQRADRARLPAEGPWSELIAEARGLPPKEQLERITAWVNGRVHYTGDSDEHWATAEETLDRRRGDCEDFAIAKLQLLRLAGFPSRDLYFVFLFDQLTRGDERGNHGFLVARVDGRYYLLDNRTDLVTDDSSPHLAYRPSISYSSEGAWVHGFPRDYEFGRACPLTP